MMHPRAVRGAGRRRSRRATRLRAWAPGVGASSAGRSAGARLCREVERPRRRSVPAKASAARRPAFHRCRPANFDHPVRTPRRLGGLRYRRDTVTGWRRLPRAARAPAHVGERSRAARPADTVRDGAAASRAGRCRWRRGARGGGDRAAGPGLQSAAWQPAISVARRAGFGRSVGLRPRRHGVLAGATHAKCSPPRADRKRRRWAPRRRGGAPLTGSRTVQALSAASPTSSPGVRPRRYRRRQPGRAADGAVRGAAGVRKQSRCAGRPCARPADRDQRRGRNGSATTPNHGVLDPATRRCPAIPQRTVVLGRDRAARPSSSVSRRTTALAGA